MGGVLLKPHFAYIKKVCLQQDLAGAKERFSDATALLPPSTPQRKLSEGLLGTEHEVGGAQERVKLVRACRGGPGFGLRRERMKIRARGGLTHAVWSTHCTAQHLIATA